MALKDSILAHVDRFSPLFEMHPSEKIAASLNSELSGVRYEGGYSVPPEFTRNLLDLYESGEETVSARRLLQALLSIHGMTLEYVRSGEVWINLRDNFNRCGGHSTPGRHGDSSPNQSDYSAEEKTGSRSRPSWTLWLRLVRKTDPSQHQHMLGPALELDLKGTVDQRPAELIKAGDFNRLAEGMQIWCEVETPHGGRAHVGLEPTGRGLGGVEQRLLVALGEQEHLYNPRALLDRATSLSLSKKTVDLDFKVSISREGWSISAAVGAFTRDSWRDFRTSCEQAVSLFSDHSGRSPND